MPLAFTLALTSLTYLLGIGGVDLIILPIKILGGVDSFVLLAIPLFILAGALMESGGISERIVDLAMAIVGRVRGGLAMVVVVAEILFSGISGSTAADVSAISSLLVPSMKRAGYSGAESVSVVAAASAMGILVPPCLTMVVLGSLVNLSIVTLFLAGFLPAFVLAAVLLGADRASAPGDSSGRSAHAPTRRPLARVRRAAVPTGLPVMLFGGIFSGLTTVTEAALLAVVYAFVAGPRWAASDARELRSQLAQRRSDRDDAVGAGGGVRVRVDSGARVGAADCSASGSPASAPGKAGLMAMTVVLFVVIGALLEGLPALLIFGPILFPISRTVGIDPVHYGVVIIAAMGIAFFLPPVGVGLSIAAGIARVDIDDVSAVLSPYLIALLMGLALIAAFPSVTLVLPRLWGYRG